MAAYGLKADSRVWQRWQSRRCRHRPPYGSWLGIGGRLRPSGHAFTTAFGHALHGSWQPTSLIVVGSRLGDRVPRTRRFPGRAINPTLDLGYRPIRWQGANLLCSVFFLSVGG